MSVRSAVTSSKPDVRLAYNPGPINQYGALDEPVESYRPALLVSYAYLDPFLRWRERYRFRDWVLDSGAFTAFQSGKPVDLQAYIDTAARLLEDDPLLTEVFSLDVIGDWEASARNTEEMVRQGVPAIPCYHFDEPVEALLEMAGRYPKIALGGVAAKKAGVKKEWIGQCFARVWPKRIHGFGVGTEDLVMSFPFESVDATNWEMGPCAFGNWAVFGRMSIRGTDQDLRAEIEWYRRLEARARNRWQREMSLLGVTDAPVYRLAEAGPAGTGRRPWLKTD